MFVRKASFELVERIDESLIFLPQAIRLVRILSHLLSIDKSQPQLDYDAKGKTADIPLYNPPRFDLAIPQSSWTNLKSVRLDDIMPMALDPSSFNISSPPTSPLLPCLRFEDKGRKGNTSNDLCSDGDYIDSGDSESEFSDAEEMIKERTSPKIEIILTDLEMFEESRALIGWNEEKIDRLEKMLTLMM
jgi:hypothetical protein